MESELLEMDLNFKEKFKSNIENLNEVFLEKKRKEQKKKYYKQKLTN
ncbi:hypothetical protein H8B09_19425 [Paenibacillus sp. PR3]|uniref:FbpB family small basic protein n=1 Tax=Paenibacillus terricola TaxID=2763503 RepID=A0ABR8N114_9BACL|nr:hypothetical protein [Paenibacillus terricola]MBD3920946.1 hypothetical protein [Paenibacillus terricola]